MTIALSISLASAGNAFISGLTELDSYFSTHPVFDEITSISFSEKSGLIFPKEKVLTLNPVEWLSIIKRRGCSRLELSYRPVFIETPLWKVADVSGGGFDWFLRVTGVNVNSSWQVISLPPESDGNLHVTVKKAEKTVHNPLRELSLIDTKNRLQNILMSCAGFASDHSLHEFSEIFNIAITILNSDNPDEYSDYDLLLKSQYYPLEAIQLVCAASTSWVFASEKSWGFLEFPDEIENNIYRELSYELYESIIESLVSGTNSFRLN